MTLTFVCFITQTRTLLQLAAGENNKQEKKTTTTNNTYEENEQKSVYSITEAFSFPEKHRKTNA